MEYAIKLKRDYEEMKVEDNGIHRSFRVISVFLLMLCDDLEY